MAQYLNIIAFDPKYKIKLQTGLWLKVTVHLKRKTLSLFVLLHVISVWLPQKIDILINVDNQTTLTAIDFHRINANPPRPFSKYLLLCSKEESHTHVLNYMRVTKSYPYMCAVWVNMKQSYNPTFISLISKTSNISHEKTTETDKIKV